MKKLYLAPLLALPLIILLMSCQALSTLASSTVTPSNPAQTPTVSAFPLTATPSSSGTPIPSPISSGTASVVSVSDVTNTHWAGEIYDQNNPYHWEVFEIIFLPDGKLRYYVPNAWNEDGTWKQSGNNIILEWNNHTCDFYGVLSGNAIAGAQKCTDGTTQGWSVKLKSP
jgi:hypothetical protein